MKNTPNSGAAIHACVDAATKMVDVLAAIATSTVSSHGRSAITSPLGGWMCELTRQQNCKKLSLE
jgi:hypothetical protein